MRSQKLALIGSDPVLRALVAVVEQRMQTDAAHDLAHCLRVADWTIRIAGDSVPDRLCIAAALLHDIVNVPKNHPDRPRASELSAGAAREILGELGFDAADIELVAHAIRDHSFTRGAVPDSMLGKALQDADRLEALGVIGTFRCIATGVRFDAQFFDADDPWAERRALDDKRFSVDHFFVKLFKLPATFQTAAGRAEAMRRVEIMRAMVVALGEELGKPFTPNEPRTSDAARD
jgi:uncharacterized protein